MQRRSFVRQSLFLGSVFAMPRAWSRGVEIDKKFQDGHSFYLDEEGTAHLLSHNAAQNLFCQRKLFSHGESLDSEETVFYDRNQLLYTVFHHPKRKSNLLLYCQFSARSQRLSRYHFLKIDPFQDRPAFMGTYQTGGGPQELTGREKILLLWDDNTENGETYVLYSHNDTIQVGFFTGENSAISFTKSDALDAGVSELWHDAQWMGPYNGLMGDEKHAIIAVHKTQGLAVFCVQDGQLRLMTHIQNGQVFGNFIYQSPKLTPHNWLQPRTQFFEVITPHVPAGMLTSRDVLMLTTGEAVHFLSFNVHNGNFELIFEDDNFFQNQLAFTALQNNYQRENHPDLFLFRNEKSHYYSLLKFEKGCFTFDLNRIPHRSLESHHSYVGMGVKRNVALQAADPQEINKETHLSYPLTFERRNGDSDYYELKVPKNQKNFDNNSSCTLVNSQPGNDNDSAEESSPMQPKNPDSGSQKNVALYGVILGLALGFCVSAARCFYLRRANNALEEQIEKFGGGEKSSELFNDMIGALQGKIEAGVQLQNELAAERQNLLNELENKALEHQRLSQQHASEMGGLRLEIQRLKEALTEKDEALKIMQALIAENEKLTQDLESTKDQRRVYEDTIRVLQDQVASDYENKEAFEKFKKASQNLDSEPGMLVSTQDAMKNLSDKFLAEEARLRARIAELETALRAAQKVQGGRRTSWISLRRSSASSVEIK